MLPLDPSLRKLLENKVPDARLIAEEAARAILTTLAVNRPEPYPAMTLDQRQLRNALRAKARQLGNGSQVEGFAPLIDELAYHQWHCMVFARFLAENSLLMHPSGVSVSLQECGELAQEEGEMDAWAVAAKYAALMLPGIFRQEDPESQVRFAPEGQQKLETLLNGLPSPIFLANDALGWMYQFWQKNKKEEVNESGRKIGGADIAPVTQLFTEDYMVRFLLENSLGAWWAARHPDSPLIKEWQYLRFKEDGSPAAGTFPGWPERASEVTVMDPCCGSGHFLVAGFEMLVRMRMEEEGLSIADAGEAVLRQNLFGLELDMRCTQIAAFALALSAWKSDGYRPLPVPNVACSGIPVQGQLETWLKLAGDDSRLRLGLERLYGLFKNAPDLGSLINPADLPAADRMFVADYEQVAPVLELALVRERAAADPVTEIFGAAVQGIVKAVQLLSRKYTLISTNVPYVKRANQGEVLQKYCYEHFKQSSANLATSFLERCRQFTSPEGLYATVTPESWLFLGSYESLRKTLLKEQSWYWIVNLGIKAFQTPMWDFNVGLTIIANYPPDPNRSIIGLDASLSKTPLGKSNFLQTAQLMVRSQREQLTNPDSRISLQDASQGILLREYADAFAGIQTGDYPKYTRLFWESDRFSYGWEYYASAPNAGTNNLGLSQVIPLYKDGCELSKEPSSVIRGKSAWNKEGVLVGLMKGLASVPYTGYKYDQMCAVIISKRKENSLAIRAFVESEEYRQSVKRIDKSIKVTPATLTKVPFDLVRWQKVAEQAGPLPEPHSEDPTQWLFMGQPLGSTDPLQVAISRLLGYKWPQQKPDALDGLADNDGIICLPPVAGERPLSKQLRELLSVAYRAQWSPHLQAELLNQAGASGKKLEDWLRDDFFTLHCRLFHNRPFIWHIWDGRKDGFSALVNYHELDSARLDKLIYTYLGDWIRFQRARRDYGEPGADGRLVAALDLERKLKLIKEGEPPYDIYVRWKSLNKQPIGWDPDLNDGVRLNIRPFVTVGVLRSKFTINWNKDRGKNPDGSERLNDLHYTIAEKQAARRGKI